jgi:hypothetical protein
MVSAQCERAIVTGVAIHWHQNTKAIGRIGAMLSKAFGQQVRLMGSAMIDSDDEYGPVATYGEAFKEYARNAGHERPDSEWILTPWDTWEKNPWYSGKPGRHPEDDYDENYPPDEVMTFAPRDFNDDDIPF